mgnify:CR=1 FL=1
MSLFKATNDILSFTYDVTGTWKYEIGGFSTDQLLAFDISDPYTVQQITGGITIPVSSTFSFQFADQITAPTTYWVMATSELLSPESIALDTPSDLQAPAHAAVCLFALGLAHRLARGRARGTTSGRAQTSGAESFSDANARCTAGRASMRCR